ncbi:Clavaminate synthase-like protein [Lophiostoma macrostomum CBS 122681]|uniref:Clavaminate synthase-like protein n=1 Tax=Lophiostoma macrostomum CBS 122681 TaxID=1314788 RepID=A0A6A6T1B6_9PLEO|nr:Clavaminate synthase-like protein [Lophiostoma macrostomum CBS 122681]
MKTQWLFKQSAIGLLAPIAALSLPSDLSNADLADSFSGVARRHSDPTIPDFRRLVSDPSQLSFSDETTVESPEFAVEDAFSGIVNIGDQLQSWTNGLYVSTFHRVLNYSGEERYSIPFFFSANFETVIKPIEKFVPAGSTVEYEDITAGEMYKNAMIRFHTIAKNHPVFSRYLRKGIHDEEYEGQDHFVY